MVPDYKDLLWEKKIELDKVELDESLESFCSSRLTKMFRQEHSVLTMIDWSRARSSDPNHSFLKFMRRLWGAMEGINSTFVC